MGGRRQDSHPWLQSPLWVPCPLGSIKAHSWKQVPYPVQRQSLEPEDVVFFLPNPNSSGWGGGLASDRSLNLILTLQGQSKAPVIDVALPHPTPVLPPVHWESLTVLTSIWKQCSQGRRCGPPQVAGLINTCPGAKDLKQGGTLTSHFHML